MRFVHFVSLIMYRGVGIRLPHSFWPIFGQFFSEFRRWMLIGMGCSIGKSCDLEPHVDVGFAPRLKIGIGCHLNRGVTLRTAQLGNHVMLAPGVILLDRHHKFSRLDIPMSEQGASTRTITVIEDDVWIGQNAIVMPGITIATGAIVAAGAVVTHDVAAFEVVAGVPARRIRNRREKR